MGKGGGLRNEIGEEYRSYIMEGFVVDCVKKLEIIFEIMGVSR